MHGMPRPPNRGGPPPARGSLDDAEAARAVRGWTPASAGEPRRARRWRAGRWGGRPASAGEPGQSRASGRAASGWTPASAGEPSLCPSWGVILGVDPRQRGGAPFASTVSWPMRGGPPPARGSLHARPRDGDPGGWTPASAGEPRSADTSRHDRGVDPRQRGGALPREPAPQNATRVDPRQRGGAPHASIHRRLKRVDPRQRGGAYARSRIWTARPGGPPPARGSHRIIRRYFLRGGWTPASAGEPARAGAAARGERVDPRQRGGALA